MSDPRFPYVSGTCLAQCDRCGRKYYRNELRHDGQKPGLLVCHRCYDVRHPQTVVHIPPSINRITEPRPEGADVFGTGADGTLYPKSF